MKSSKPRVLLVRYTPEPDELIASAAKLCYAADAGKIMQQERAKARQFVARLRAMGHMSPIEHASFTFFMEGVSRAMTHQLVRHRIASYSQRSQRYVAHDSFAYIIPPRLEGKKVILDGHALDAVRYYEETMALIAERYAKLCDALGQAGEPNREDARYVLPNACETKIFVTMNARELLYFFAERLCLRAQWEIRGVAEQMLRLAREVCPSVFEDAGPKCIRNRGCPEGPMSCGRYQQVAERYGAGAARAEKGEP